MTTHIKFEVDVKTWYTSEPDPNDQWDNGCTEGIVTIQRAVKVAKDDYDVLSINADIPVDTTVYLVWAQYSTGDSFGSYGGSYELLDVVLTLEEAESRKQHFLSVTDYSVPWNGYFESLDSLNIEVLTLEAE